MIRSSSLRRLSIRFFYLFCGTLPFAGYSIHTGVIRISLTNIALLATFGLTLLSLTNDRIVVVSQRQLQIVGFGLILGVIISLQVLIFDTVRARLLITFLGCLLTLITVTFVVNSRRILYRTLLATTVGVASFSAIGFAAGVGLIEPVTETYRSMILAGVTLPFIRTIGGPLAHGTYGVLLTVSMSTTFLYIVTPHTQVRRGVMAILCILCSLGFVVGQSRSTLLALLVTFGVIAVYLYHQPYVSSKLEFKILYQSAKAGAIVGALPVAHVLYSARPGSANVRLDQTIVAIHQIIQYPLVGSTRETTMTETGGYIIHNAFLGIGALFGLPALLVLGLIWVSCIRSGTQSVTHGRDPVLAIVLLAAILGATVEHLLYFGVFSKTTWFLLGLVVAGNNVLVHKH